MSTYDMIVGRRFYAPLLFAVAFPGVNPNHLPRLRDVYFNAAKEIELLSKTGPDAWHGQDENNNYRGLPGFLGEAAVEKDRVYAKWRYSWPGEAETKATLEKVWNLVGPFDPIAEMFRILADMQAGKDTPEVKRALENGKPLVDQIQAIIKKQDMRQ